MTDYSVLLCQNVTIGRDQGQVPAAADSVSKSSVEWRCFLTFIKVPCRERKLELKVLDTVVVPITKVLNRPLMRVINQMGLAQLLDVVGLLTRSDMYVMVGVQGHRGFEPLMFVLV